jgi:hypothetical protein
MEEGTDKRRLQNEKVIFGNIAFGVGTCISCSNDGKGKCKRQHCFAAARRICRTSGGSRDT